MKKYATIQYQSQHRDEHDETFFADKNEAILDAVGIWACVRSYALTIPDEVYVLYGEVHPNIEDGEEPCKPELAEQFPWSVMAPEWQCERVVTVLRHGDPVYYIANDDHIDQIYGTEEPVCVDLLEVARLAREWDMTVADMLEQFHEATYEEIEEFGTYDTPAPKYFTADREAGNIIAGFATYAEAKQAIAEYEKEDLLEGNYTPDFYDIVDSEHCTIEEE